MASATYADPLPNKESFSGSTRCRFPKELASEALHTLPPTNATDTDTNTNSGIAVDTTQGEEGARQSVLPRRMSCATNEPRGNTKSTSSAPQTPKVPCTASRVVTGMT